MVDSPPTVRVISTEAQRLTFGSGSVVASALASSTYFLITSAIDCSAAVVGVSTGGTRIVTAASPGEEGGGVQHSLGWRRLAVGFHFFEAEPSTGSIQIARGQ